jgi:spore germination cell wall hydrolase CwlJ-like protein
MTLNTPPPMTSANIPPPDGSAPTAMPSTPRLPPMNPVDRDNLIKTVNGEAGSEPPEGQAAVVHVILNRLAAGGYGNSITDIAKAPAAGVNPALGYHEFSMWNPPNKQGNKGANLDPNSDAYARIGDVVDKAYYGGIPDPTGGATHYYAGQPPRQWPQDWLATQPKVKIGKQVFVGGASGPGQKPTVVGALGG